MIGARAAVDIQRRTVGADDNSIKNVIESRSAPRIRLRLRQEGPRPSASSVGFSGHDPRKGAVFVIGIKIADDVNGAVRPDGHALSAVCNAVIGCAIDFDANRSSIARQDAEPENISVEFEIVELVVTGILGDADGIGPAAIGGVQKQADLEIGVED